MRHARRATVAGIAVAGALAAGVIPAAAGGKANVTVTLTVADNVMGDDHFYGHVGSSRPVCEKEGRKVKLLDKQGDVVSKGVTDEFSEYNVTLANPHPDGKYRVKAPGNAKCQTGISKAKFAAG